MDLSFPQIRQAPAGIAEELGDVSRRLDVQDTALSCLETRVNALRNDTDARITDLSKKLEAQAAQSAATAAAGRAAQM